MVGSLAILLLVITGLGIAAAIFIPQMVRETNARNANRSNTNRNENRVVITNTNINSNENGNANANTNNQNLNENDSENNNASDKAPPTDEEVVLDDLKNIEDEWTAANLNADKKKLARILADDYVSSASGKVTGKADYLRDIQPDPSIQHWEFQDLKLKLNGSHAMLSGTVRLEGATSDQSQTLHFTDKFVWRDGRWQATGSEVTPAK